MDNQKGVDNKQLPLQIEHAFGQLYGRLPHEEARLRLWKFKQLFKFEDNDPLWGVLLALEYHYAIPQSLTSEMEGLSEGLESSIASALERSKVFERAITQALTSIQDQSLGELIQYGTTEPEQKIRKSSQETLARLVQDLAYVHGIGKDSRVKEPVQREYQRMLSNYRGESNDSYRKMKRLIDWALVNKLPGLNQILLRTVLAVSGVLLCVTFYFAIDLIGHYSIDDSASRMTKSQQALQSRFYHSLDKKTQAILHRRNAQLSPDRQLYFGPI